MSFTPVESLFGGAALAFTIYWHTRYLPATIDAPPSLRSTISIHPLSVAFTTGQISVGILLSRILPTLFHPLPFVHIPFQRLILASVLLSAGITLANACPNPHLSPFVRPSSPLLLALCLLVASVTSTLFASARFFTSLSSHAYPVLTALAFPPRSQIYLLAYALLLCTVLPPLLSGLQPRPTPLMLETLSYVLGACVATALVAANALHPAKLLSMLDVEADTWDPSLCVMVLSVVVVSASLPITQTECDVEDPYKRRDSSVHEKHTCAVCARALLGAVLFGIGCGLGGISPHCALIYFGAFPTRLETVAVVVSMLFSTAVCSLALSLLDERTVGLVS